VSKSSRSGGNQELHFDCGGEKRHCASGPETQRYTSNGTQITKTKQGVLSIVILAHANQRHRQQQITESQAQAYPGVRTRRRPRKQCGHGVRPQAATVTLGHEEPVHHRGHECNPTCQFGGFRIARHLHTNTRCEITVEASMSPATDVRVKPK